MLPHHRALGLRHGLLGAGVGVGHTALAVELDDQVGRAFDQLAEPAVLIDNLAFALCNGACHLLQIGAQPLQLDDAAAAGHPVVASSGHLLREDAQNDLSNVLKLQYERVDMVVLQASSLAYLRTQVGDFDQWASVSPTLQPSYQRYLFTSTANPQLMVFLQQALVQLAQAPEWAELQEVPLP